ncbi:MAG TPA: excinuclease ABC subunit UvrA [Candidatus Cryptobacteroides merdipullorum]|uniref:UvrABC system protein A n=1 Tax=Candidatus Cryptobacteroides merdipullorum TaxID=2840771 RepID=A0A9D1GQ09_9BACT|nr:excinuclease ABC subunit UvrA [Candidatus Cryptobacteroides merdipullorum]
MAEENIEIRGARVNNLKNLSLDIPRGKFVVVTGISGSGKSSLVFDTLYAEGQRRFSESLSSYARQFLGRMTKPDVDSIDGIPPAIAIEQKVTTRNPRSTVATTTEIYDYLRLVFARAGHTFSPVSGREVHKDTVDTVMAYLERTHETCYVLADLKWAQRDDKVELMLGLKEDGFNRLYADGGPVRIDDVLQKDGNYPDEAWLLVDRVRLPENGEMDADTRTRLLSSVATAFSKGDGDIAVALEDGGMRHFCSRFELDGIVFREPDEYLFSFNSPLGACPVCGGLGKIIGVSEDLVIPDKTKSIYDGAIACWRGEKMGWFKDHLIKVAERYGIPVFEPWCNLSAEVKKIIWEGHSVEGDENSIVGIKEFFDWVETQRYKIQFKYMLSRFSGRTECRACGGSRLRKEALWVRVDGKNIHEVLQMNVDTALKYFRNLTLSDTEREIVAEPLAEIVSRLECIKDVGLSYLTLNRACNTLSGGESQRINLVTALGSSLVGSMYILDEPSIGLHPRDTEKLIGVLRRLRDIGNSVIVVEHDEEIMRAADLLIDMGPFAGRDGGEVVFSGKLGGDLPQDAVGRSVTLQYLSGLRGRYRRERRTWQYSITVKGAMEHNLKDIDVRFPLGVLTVVTGVSGSGKSSLVGDILYPALYRRIHDSGDQPGIFRGLAGNLDRITRVEYVDQNPIGRSSRSNAVTYLKAYDDIRKLLAAQQYAKINGFGPNYFSFNTDGGRCPECQGEGVVRIEMQFMADVEMVCEACGGKRFKPEVLEVRYRGKNIDDMLNMSVDEAIEFFGAGNEAESQAVADKLRPLREVGLGYIKLGQSSSTLSGGESQRIKLAYFLSVSRNSGKPERIMFIFDEPTTGLHFYDVEKLLKAFDVLLRGGHSLVVVEHNPDVIRSADWIIDLGPDAGDAGGQVVFEGTPEDLKNTDTFTARYI